MNSNLFTISNRRKWVYGYFFIAPWLIGFIIFTAGPLIVSLFLSLTDYDILTSPRFIGIKNYWSLFTNDHLFSRALANTVVYTFTSVPIGLVGSLLLAIGLNTKVVGRNFLRTVFYLPTLVPMVATALLWKWVLNPEYGIVNWILSLFGIKGPPWLHSPSWALPAIIFMSFWQIGGSRMLIFLSGLQNIPLELYDAVETDGGNWWVSFRHVTIPMLSPTVLFNLIQGIIGSFQVFSTVFIMTGGGPNNSTLVYVLYLYRNAFEWFRMGYASALAWIMWIMLLVFTIIQLRLADRWVYYAGK